MKTIEANDITYQGVPYNVPLPNHMFYQAAKSALPHLGKINVVSINALVETYMISIYRVNYLAHGHHQDAFEDYGQTVWLVRYNDTADLTALTQSAISFLHQIGMKEFLPKSWIIPKVTIDIAMRNCYI